METPPILVELLLLTAIAAAGVALFERLRLPAIAGFLVMGTLVGPGGLGLVSEVERVRALAELGVVFLLFEIGLEFPTERLRRLWREALLAGGVQVAATLGLVAGGALLLGLGLQAALVLGGLVAMSSTALVMRLLVDRGETDAPQGQLAVGILLFQDLCIVPFLLAVPILAASDAASPLGVGLALLQASGALVLFFLGARFLLPLLLDRVSRSRSRDLFSLVALLVVVGSGLAAQELGLTFAVGAFIAGLVVSASPYAHQLFAESLPLRGVLLGLFFTAVGMLLEPGQALREWSGVLLYVTSVVLVKTAVVVAMVLFVLRRSIRHALLTGTLLAQTGEFSFVLAAAAVGAGLLAPALEQIFVAGSVVTLIATPFLVGAAPRLAALLGRGADRIQAEAPAGAARGLSGHAVLVGYGIAGRTLARVLRALAADYVIVEANGRTVQQALAAGEPIVYGDASRRVVLEHLGVQRARLVVIAISDPLATRDIVTAVRALAPDAVILARTRYVLEVDALSASGANVVVAEEFEATLDLLSESLRVWNVAEGAILRFVAELREEGYEPLRITQSLPLDPWLSELLEQVATEWLDVAEGFAESSISELSVRQRTGASLLAVDRGGVVTPNPEPDFGLRSGDRVLAFGEPSALARLRALLAP